MFCSRECGAIACRATSRPGASVGNPTIESVFFAVVGRDIDFDGAIRAGSIRLILENIQSRRAHKNPQGFERIWGLPRHLVANLIGSISMLPQRKGSARWVNYNLRSWSEILKRIQQLLGNINNQGYYDYLAEKFRCGALTD